MRCGRIRLTLAVLVAMLCGACASVTVEHRIQRHAALFATFPPEVQDKIRRGEVEIGFTEDMVRIALGTPNRIVIHKTPEGETTVWVYVEPVPETYVEPWPVYWPCPRGPGRWYPDLFWSYRTAWREVVVARISFRDGRVIAVERIRR
jgi:hypothetical protein